MESNPAYGFVQQNTASETPTDENTYELVHLPATTESETPTADNTYEVVDQPAASEGCGDKII